jgi:hypothetical protein
MPELNIMPRSSRVARCSANQSLFQFEPMDMLHSELVAGWRNSHQHATVGQQLRNAQVST